MHYSNWQLFLNSSSSWHQVHLELLYCPYGTESSFKNPFNSDFQLTILEKTIKSGTDGTEDTDLKTSSSPKKNVIVRGVLSVTVIAAEDLPPVDLNGKADPYVVLIMKKSETKLKTRVSSKFLIPVPPMLSFLFSLFNLLTVCLKNLLFLNCRFGQSTMESLMITLKVEPSRLCLAGQCKLLRTLISSYSAHPGCNWEPKSSLEPNIRLCCGGWITWYVNCGSLGPWHFWQGNVFKPSGSYFNFRILLSMLALGIVSRHWPELQIFCLPSFQASIILISMTFLILSG